MNKFKPATPDSRKWISVFGARENNLKNINVKIPKESLTVITGPSGSGKSSLALDILYAEGQRRYIESLSSYARQFLGVPPKPNVDRIEGLCPSIAIDQKTVGANPRSTVGTITEIYDYLRVLMARIGKVHCPDCKKLVQAESPETITHRLQYTFSEKNVTVAAPIVIEKKGEFINELERFFLNGFYKFLIDGQNFTFKSLDDLKKVGLKKTYKHSIDVLIDTVHVSKEELPRLNEAVERAFSFTNGLCKIIVGEEHFTYSSERMCINCAKSFPEIEPRLFSFNSPIGACKECHGLGNIFSVQLPNSSEERPSWWMKIYERYAYERGEMSEQACPACAGMRLNSLALSVTVGGANIFQISDLSVKNAIKFFQQLKLDETEKLIAERLLAEIINRYNFLSDVGLQYLTLNRTSRTLSGGESQRIRLATQIGSALSGVLYVLDEPSIGLHQRDNDRLILTLKKLRDQGNTILVVEHDLDTMKNADYIIDIGPAAGNLGGTIVASGTPKDIIKSEKSITGAYLAGKKSLERETKIRKANKFITLSGAKKYNLKNITAKFPLEVLCGISGVSGSGKSTLVIEELVPALKIALEHKKHQIEFEKIKGYESIDSLVLIDQSPIGRTSRSNPATYLGIFDEIRNLYASLPESNARGYKSGRFSFNVKQGRCAACDGDGVITISMHFLPDVTITCNRCKGFRYNEQTLEILYKGKNIADILNMTAREALEFFEAHKPIERKLRIMCEVGLDYLKLGQSSTTLSGGEAQRIKLVDELAKRGQNTVYILDEPTTGLHSCDIEKLMHVLNRLVNKGNSVIIIEHNIEVLKTMDYLIDLGPEGGDEGGEIIAMGTPEEIAENPKSVTGLYLKKSFSHFNKNEKFSEKTN